MNRKKDIYLMNGFVQLNTQSPNNLFFYRITTPKEITNGNWGCKIKFYKESGELLYFNINTYAHWIDLKDDNFNIVVWSKDGEVAVYYEFKYGEKYDLVMLFLNDGFLYKLDLRKDSELGNTLLTIKNSNKQELNDKFRNNLLKIPFKIDEAIENKFFNEKWYPVA